MSVKKSIFRYRVITNLNCNMNESTGPHGNCYFCYQPLKEPLQLDMAKAISTMDKVGILKRATLWVVSLLFEKIYRILLEQ